MVDGPQTPLRSLQHSQTSWLYFWKGKREGKGPKRKGGKKWKGQGRTWDSTKFVRKWTTVRASWV